MSVIIFCLLAAGESSYVNYSAMSKASEKNDLRKMSSSGPFRQGYLSFPMDLQRNRGVYRHLHEKIHELGCSMDL